MIFAGKFRVKAKEIMNQQEIVSINQMKRDYKELYALFDSLPQWNQRKNEDILHEVRKVIEAQLVSEKKVQSLLQQLQTGNIEKHRNSYGDLHVHYRKLSSDTQKEYYTGLVEIRDRFERGM
ncbi:hypothetical protein J4444_04450 [Candidatus Woesearchaeota archaeon]|nr:hypothetical protein [Candidatus Woesearchaeota archaeon]